MGPPSYIRSVVDRNVVMRHIYMGIHVSEVQKLLFSGFLNLVNSYLLRLLELG